MASRVRATAVPARGETERVSTTGVSASAGPVAVETPLEPAAIPPSAASDREPTGSFDEAAEAAFLAEARERGEVVKPRSDTIVDPVEEIDSKPLPALDDLVAKIPAEVRETLEDLFRAKFVTVRRLPKKALKP